MNHGKSIVLGEGAGGEMMQRMLSSIVLPHIRRAGGGDGGLPPDLLDDSAVIDDIALTIDGHTVWPLEFPGGDIGKLSVYGTVNDLAVVGARPGALALSLVVEEGLDRDLLERLSRSIGEASERANVQVITGDTKVVERGGVRGLVVTTAGMGRRHEALAGCIDRAMGLRPPSIRWDQRWLRDDAVRPGDHILLSGSVGDHGIAVLSFREGYGYETEVGSDMAPLNGLMEEAMKVGGVVAAKDLTRGGLANALNEWASKSGHGILVRGQDIPVKGPVLSACDMLGLDPYEIGNEGKLILGIVDGMEEEVLKVVRRTPEGKDAVLIGRAVGSRKEVILETEVGGTRIMDPPYGDPVPRIC